MKNTKPQIVICPDIQTLAQEASERFGQLAAQAVTERGRFLVALAGGSTPETTYMLLANEPYRTRVSWQKIHVFWSDERCVPPDNPESNYRMVHKTLLSQVPIPSENIHRMAGERDNPAEAAHEYAEVLRNCFHLKESTWPRFDLILLGMGEDGHVASLFPETGVLEEVHDMVVALYVPELKAYRLTLTLPVLNQAAHVVFLVTGRAKAAALRSVLEEGPEAGALPAHRVRPAKGELLWLVDREAASLLGRREDGEQRHYLPSL